MTNPTYKTLVNNGPSSNRINIVIIGDGYTSSDLDSLYPNHYNSIINDMFANQAISEPFASYAKYFNVYAISISSKESGADQPLKSITVDTALNSSFSWGGSVERLLSFDTSLANTAMSQAFKGTNISPHMKLGIVNTSKYGGAGGQWAVSYATDKANLLLHEIGHSYVGLADEYESAGGTVPTSEPSELNVTMDSTGSKWSHWMGYDDGILGPIGVFEGGKYTSTGVYRPTKSSMMRDLSKPFDAIAQEAFILQFYTDIDHADDYSLKGTNYKGTDYTYSVGESVNGGKSSSSGRGTKNPVTFTEVNHSDTIYARWLNYNGVPGTKYKLWKGWKWELDVKDVLRIEDSSGKVLADIDCTGDKYVVNADGTITQTNDTHAMQFISEGDYINNPGAFLVDPLDTDKITIEWTVAGNKLDSKKGKYSLEVQDLNLSNGTHKVTATLEDPTTKVRKSNTIMKKTIDWEIKIDNSNTTWTTDGTFGDDTINLGDGNDVVTGQEGNDTIYGGKGNDIITGGDGNDIITGGDGTDTINAGKGDDAIRIEAAGKGDGDTMNGGDGSDVLELSTGKHTFADDNKLKNVEIVQTNATGSEVLLAAQTEAFTVTGADGVDKITGGQGADTINAGKGADEITIAATGKGDGDTMDGGDGSDVLNLSSGKHTFAYDSKLKNIETVAMNTSGSEVILTEQLEAFTVTGSDSVDKINSGKGADTINAGKGNDIINAGSGANLTNAGQGDDIIFLTPDSTWSAGQKAWNINSSKVIFSILDLNGKNKFEDATNGNTGADILNLTSGPDAFFLHDTNSYFHSSISLTKDSFAKNNASRLTSIETINAGDGNDIVDLTSTDLIITDAMVLNGEAGDDYLWASNGDDTLNGGDGNDSLFGGKGVDTLTGGLGADIFEFSNDCNNDVIKDYNKGQGDQIRFCLQKGDTETIALQGNNKLKWGSNLITLENANLTSLNELIIYKDPQINFAQTSSSGDESVGKKDLIIELSHTSVKDIMVDYKVSGTASGSEGDHGLKDGQIAIKAGHSSTTLTISNIADDSFKENNEIIIITLTSPINSILGSARKHTYTITDNDSSSGMIIHDLPNTKILENDSLIA